MSLLLLFPSGIASTGTGTSSGFACWAVVATSSVDWTVSHYDFNNLWSEWATFSWGALQSSGVTWAGMSGITFTDVSTTPTSWSTVLVATCP